VRPKHARSIRKPAIAAGVIALMLALAAPANATYPGDNGKIFFTANAVVGGMAQGSPDVWSVNPDGSDLVNLTDLPGGVTEGYDPAADGTGKLITFTTGSQATAEIWTMNADGSNPHRATNDNLLDQQSVLSPTGSRIVFMRFSDYPTYVVRDIWSMNFDGSSQAVLVDSTLQQFWPAFTPDGNTIVLAHETGGNNFDIASVPSSGGPFDNTTLITTAATEEINPSVSPDGTRVAFTRWPDGFPIGSMPDVISTNMAGGDEQPIAADPTVHESFPAYSPDGTKIVYVDGTNSGSLVVANANGSNPVPVPLDPDVAVFPLNPDWAPAEVVKPPPDTTAPETTITKKPKKRISKPKAKVRFVSSEPGSSFECKIDKKPYKPCQSPRKLKHLKPGRHKFRVRATDAAANTDPTPAKAKFKVVENK
jgi:dipeptidyl aminopeptidase/acylaminoacyl peptidase